MQDEFDKNLKEYKERSTKHNSPIKSINNQPKPKEKKEFLFKAKSETNNELLRFYLKEEFLKLIFDRGSNLKESLDSLFELNPDRYQIFNRGFQETLLIKSFFTMNYFIMGKI